MSPGIGTHVLSWALQHSTGGHVPWFPTLASKAAFHVKTGQVRLVALKNAQLGVVASSRHLFL